MVNISGTATDADGRLYDVSVVSRTVVTDEFDANGLKLSIVSAVTAAGITTLSGTVSTRPGVSLTFKYLQIATRPEGLTIGTDCGFQGGAVIGTTPLAVSGSLPLPVGRHKVFIAYQLALGDWVEGPPVLVTVAPALPVAPGAPVLSGTATDRGASLTWIPQGAVATAYTALQDDAAIATVLSAAHQVTGLTNGTSYRYAVTASNSVGVSPASNTVVVVPVAVPVTSKWLSGASGNSTTNGSFGAWRDGHQVTAAGTWADSGFGVMTTVPQIVSGEYANWTGALDIACGAFEAGGSWANAKNGAYVAQWTRFLQIVADRRPASKVTFIRFAHEYTGTWYPWSLDPGSVADYKAAVHQFRLLRDAICPWAKIVIAPNGDVQHQYINGIFTPVKVPAPSRMFARLYGEGILGGMDKTLPDSSDYDIYGPDVYQWHFVGDRDILNKHLSIAVAAGKPLAMPEWGCRSDSGADSTAAAYITAINALGRAGKLVYDVYFNIDMSQKFVIYPGSNFPNGAAAMNALTWGA